MQTTVALDVLWQQPHAAHSPTQHVVLSGASTHAEPLQLAEELTTLSESQLIFVPLLPELTSNPAEQVCATGLVRVRVRKNVITCMDAGLDARSACDITR